MSIHEVPGDLLSSRVRTDEDEQRRAGPHHCIPLKRVAHDGRITAQDDPAPVRHDGKPLAIRRIMGEVIGVPVEGDAGLPYDLREDAGTEIPVRKKFQRYAACSKTIASSIACLGMS